MWIFEGSHYLYPERAYLMWGIPCVAFMQWWMIHQRQNSLRLFFGPKMPLHITNHYSPFLLVLRTALLCLAWMMACVALMHPYTMHDAVKPPASQTHSSPGSKRRLAHDVILLIDTSASMAVTDGRSAETRLASAKEIAEALIKQMHGESVALYSFTTRLIPEVPLTLDYLFLRLMLRQLSFNQEETAGTDIYQSLEDLRAKYWGDDRPTERSFSLVLFSDGGDATWEFSTESAKFQRLQKIAEVFKGIPALQMITVGVGSLQGGIVPHVLTDQNRPVQSVLQPQLLQVLATSDGKYIDGNSASAYETSRKIVSLLARHAQYRETTKAGIAKTLSEQLPEAKYHFPLSLAILSLAAALLLPLSVTPRSSP